MGKLNPTNSVDDSLIKLYGNFNGCIKWRDIFSSVLIMLPPIEKQLVQFGCFKLGMVRLGDELPTFDTACGRATYVATAPMTRYGTGLLYILISIYLYIKVHWNRWAISSVLMSSTSLR